MSEIKAGDIVMVWRGIACCGAGDLTGTVFTIDRFETRSGHCSCGAYAERRFALAKEHALGYSLARLRRIDPLSEPERAREDLTASARSQEK